VRFKCHSARYQPALVLYQTVTASEPEPDAVSAAGLTLGAAAEAGGGAGGSWANMAVRCAARGGISPSVRPAAGTGAGAFGMGGARAAVVGTAARRAEPPGVSIYVQTTVYR